MDTFNLESFFEGLVRRVTSGDDPVSKLRTLIRYIDEERQKAIDDGKIKPPEVF